MNKEDVDFLISIQDLEQPDFDNACLKRENTRLQQELQRKDNIIKEIKREINEQLEEYEKGKEIYRQFGSLEDYTRGLRSAYINMLDKIKELENE